MEREREYVPRDFLIETLRRREPLPTNIDPAELKKDLMAIKRARPAADKANMRLLGKKLWEKAELAINLKAGQEEMAGIYLGLLTLIQDLKPEEIELIGEDLVKGPEITADLDWLSQTYWRMTEKYLQPGCLGIILGPLDSQAITEMEEEIHHALSQRER